MACCHWLLILTCKHDRCLGYIYWVCCSTGSGAHSARQCGWRSPRAVNPRSHGARALVASYLTVARHPGGSEECN